MNFVSFVRFVAAVLIASSAFVLNRVAGTLREIFFDSAETRVPLRK